MEDLSVLLPNVGDSGATQDAMVGVLAAPLRVEGSAVQSNGKALLLRGAGEHPGSKFHQEGVGVKQLFSHGFALLFDV